LKANTKQYTSSLLEAESLVQYQHVYFDRNVVTNMAFYGAASSLIRFRGKGQIEASENVIFDIGSVNEQKVQLPIVQPSEGKSFNYYQG